MGNNNGGQKPEVKDAEFDNVSTVSAGAADTVSVDKLTYLMLIFFLGCFGAHKFYAGQIGPAIAYLVMSLLSFLVIPLLVVVILVFYELFIAMMVNHDEEGKITLKKGFLLTKP